MFAKKKYLIWIKPTVIQLWSYSGDFQKLQDFSWSNDNLSQALLEFKKTIKNLPVSILIDDSFSYIIDIELPKSNLNRSTVQSKAQETIPDNLDDTVWDFTSTPLLDNNLYAVQVIALISSFASVLKNSLSDSQLNVFAIEPFSFSLINKMSVKGPVLVLHFSDITTCIALNHGFITATQSFPSVTIADLQKFLVYSLNLVPDISQIFLSGQPNIDISSLQTDKLVFEQLPLDPLLNLINKTDIGKPDDRNLDLRFAKTPSITKPKSRFSSIIIFGLIFLLILASAIYFFIQKPFLTKSNSLVNPTPILTPVPTTAPSLTPTPSILAKDISIAVLNASGKAGEAKKIGNILIENGYNVTSTGNSTDAPSSQISLQYKQHVPASIVAGIDNVLSKNYTVTTITQLLDQTAVADIIITIGKNK